VTLCDFRVAPRPRKIYIAPRDVMADPVTPVPGIPDSLIDPVLLAQSAAARVTAALNELPPKKPAADWTVRNEITFLKHLIENKAAAGEGTNFTQTIFKSSAVAVNNDSLEKGAPKTWESCKSKYQKVCR
jgi:hypothetical protein